MTRGEALLIASISVAVRTVLVVMIGIRDSPDSVRYIEAASNWRSNGLALTALLNESQRSPLFVAAVTLFRVLFDDWRFALVACHTLLSATLPVLLFATARRGGVSQRGSWIATLAAIGSYELSRWNAYLLTDAMFVFFSGATLCATIVALVARRMSWAIVVGLALTGARLARPSGPAVALAVLASSFIVRPVALGVLMAAAAASALGAASVLSVPGEIRRGQPTRVCTHLAAGRVIWGSETFRVTPPPDLVVSDASPTLPCIARVTTEHPGHVANVLVRRAFAYWLPLYPNYSRAHNLANVLLLGVPIALALLALVTPRTAIRTDVVRLVSACFVVSFGVFHTITWSEGDHRFLAPVLPAVCLLAGVAVQAPKRTA